MQSIIIMLTETFRVFWTLDLLQGHLSKFKAKLRHLTLFLVVLDSVMSRCVNHTFDFHLKITDRGLITGPLSKVSLIGKWFLPVPASRYV